MNTKFDDLKWAEKDGGEIYVWTKEYVSDPLARVDVVSPDHLYRAAWLWGEVKPLGQYRTLEAALSAVFAQLHKVEGA